MSRYVVERRSREGEEVVVLRDAETGAAAQLWPACGVNCFSLTLPAPAAAGAESPGRRDGLVTVIQDPPALDEIRRRPSWWGIPLLFPYPGSMPRGEYEFEGRRYRIGRPDQPVVPEGRETPGARRDNHGFVMDLPWQVAETHAAGDSATVRSTLDSVDHPQTQEGFPFPFRVEATYRLDGGGLHLRFGVANTSRGNLPFGFGAHPYFRVPLGEGGSVTGCLVRIPAARRWDARAARALLDREPPAGTAGAGTAAPEVSPPVPPELDLRTPQPFIVERYNGVYAGLALVDGMVEAFVRDPHAGLESVMRASPDFRYVVFWSPPGRAELCLEPWTCPPNVFNLAAAGVPGHGLLVLAPGERWESTMTISLRPAGQ